MTKNKKRPLSTFEREMKDPARRKRFDEKYREFELSEIVLQLMEETSISVRQLARQIGVSTSIIQEMRSGARKNVTLKTFLAVMSALGAEIHIQTEEHSFKL